MWLTSPISYLISGPSRGTNHLFLVSLEFNRQPQKGDLLSGTPGGTSVHLRLVTIESRATRHSYQAICVNSRDTNIDPAGALAIPGIRKPSAIAINRKIASPKDPTVENHRTDKSFKVKSEQIPPNPPS